MNTRVKILAAIGVAVLVFGMTFQSYSEQIKTLFDLRGRIEEAEARRAELEEQWDRYLKNQEKLTDFIERNGAMNANQVKNDLQARLNTLISETSLRSKGITGRVPRENRKSLLNELEFTVNVEGTLEQATRFLIGCESLPQVVRMSEVRISPLPTSSKNKEAEEVSLYCKLEAVAPVEKVAKAVAKRATDPQPEKLERISGGSDQYAMIWEAKPFFEWKPPPPVTPREPRKLDPVEPRDRPVRSQGKRETPRDTDAVVDMVAVYGHEGHMVEEVHISGIKHGKTKKEYLTVGDEMDDGKILVVHPLGVVVRKDDGEHFYPTGEKFENSVRLAMAEDYPQIQAYVRHLREVEARQAAQAEAQSAAEAESKAVDQAEGTAQPSNAESATEQKDEKKPSTKRSSRVPRASTRNRGAGTPASQPSANDGGVVVPMSEPSAVQPAGNNGDSPGTDSPSTMPAATDEPGPVSTS